MSLYLQLPYEILDSLLVRRKYCRMDQRFEVFILGYALSSALGRRGVADGIRVPVCLVRMHLAIESVKLRHQRICGLRSRVQRRHPSLCLFVKLGTLAQVQAQRMLRRPQPRLMPRCTFWLRFYLIFILSLRLRLRLTCVFRVRRRCCSLRFSRDSFALCIGFRRRRKYRSQLSRSLFLCTDFLFPFAGVVEVRAGLSALRGVVFVGLPFFML
jgi:hypothetical protein